MKESSNPILARCAAALAFALVAGAATHPASGAQSTPTPAVSATPLPATPIPARAGIGDPYYPLLGNRGYDALHYAIELDLDVEAGSILDATTTIDAVANADLTSFNLDYRGPQIDAITVDGADATWSRGGAELTITPATPVAAGEEFVTEVRYHGTPRVDSSDRFERGWWATGNSVFTVGEPAGSDIWYPVNGHPLDKATYTISVTVPEPYQVASNGILDSVAYASGAGNYPDTATFTWENRDPTASYLVIMHAGEIEIDPREGPRGITLYEAFPRDLGEREQRTLALVPEMVEVFSERFGPYPFSSIGSTVFPDTEFNAALETQGMIGYDLSAIREPTVAHEVAHQWLGNSVSPARWQDIWLNEGFARYAEVLWAEAAHGPEAAAASLRRQMSSLATVTRTAQGQSVLIGDPGPDRLFSEVVYAGGALTLHDLRQRVGDDAFFRILREWTSRYRHAAATTDDFIALAEEISGEELDAFFADRLFTPWTPQRVADEYGLEASPVP